MTASLFERVSALLALGLMAALALAAWLLTELALSPVWDSSYRSSTKLNAQITGAELTQTDERGQTRFQIASPSLSLFEDGSAEMSNPVMLALRNDGPPVRAHASKALVSANQNEVMLTGQALISRDAYDKESAIRIATDWVQFDINAQTAQTKAPVRVNQGNILLTGVGMKFNQKTEQIEVLSQSQMVLPGKGIRQ
ncbi:MAG: LPS export ABC transporter periplasmic protein LptC [Betaproteobacteria bacterium]|jgi:lipopolysaccharide export system protein LptC|nr:LPS export ABC transporter periplasmic protein LptC [Betaproteobacteria bacterium]